MNKTISYQIPVPAAVSDVWKAWTTEKGAKTFFAPDCWIELKPGGAYEMYFNLDAPYGEKGGEGGEWDQAFDYFTRTRGEIVLPRLQYRFEEGPIDWEDPPALGKREK